MLYDNAPLREITGGPLRPGGLELTRHGLDLCAFPAGARLLDLGCGCGSSLELLCELGFRGLGVDRSLALLREAPARISLLRADFAALPLISACLDGIVCECVLSLAVDPAPALAECARVLKAGGRMLLSDIVLRQEVSDGVTGSSRAVFPCAEGAMPLPSLLELLAAQGFAVLCAEDHSGLLTKLAAQIVWRFGSLEAFGRLWSGGGEPGEQGAFSLCWRDGGKKYGYALVIAEKRSS